MPSPPKREMRGSDFFASRFFADGKILPEYELKDRSIKIAKES